MINISNFKSKPELMRFMNSRYLKTAIFMEDNKKKENMKFHVFQNQNGFICNKKTFKNLDEAMQFYLEIEGRTKIKDG